MGKRWTLGITHLIKPPFAAELEAFGGDADILYFAGRDAGAYDLEALCRLDAFLVWTPEIDADVVARLERCRILVRYGVGYDRIDRNALKAAGIAFSNNPEYGPEDVADSAMAILLSLQRRLPEHDCLARGYTDSWQENHLAPTHHSKRTRVGIVGLGRIGGSLALRLKPFGYQVRAYDPYLDNGTFRTFDVERAETLEQLVAGVDILSLHCPLSGETRGMIDSSLLAHARPGLILVNTARGALVDRLDTIQDALKSGQLAAAGLDVLPQEPPAPHPLIDAWRAQETWLCGRLLITPHNAFYSDRSMHELRFNAAETARLYLEQGLHRNAVDDETG